MRYDFKKDTSQIPATFSLVWGPAREGQSRHPILSVQVPAEEIEDAESAITELLRIANANEHVRPLDHAVEFDDLTIQDIRDFSQIIALGGMPYPLPTKFTVESLREVIATVIDETPADLSEWAAKAAVEELSENWTAALSEGANIKSLVGDIDDVIAKLKAFRALCAERGQVTSVLSGGDA